MSRVGLAVGERVVGIIVGVSDDVTVGLAVVGFMVGGSTVGHVEGAGTGAVLAVSIGENSANPVVGMAVGFKVVGP